MSRWNLMIQFGLYYPMRLYSLHFLVHPEDRLDRLDPWSRLDLMGLRGPKDPPSGVSEVKVDTVGEKDRTGV